MKQSSSTENGSEKRYVSVKKELERVPISERTFRDLIRRGKIPSYKVGLRRILLVSAEVDRALETWFRREAPLPA